MITIKDVYKTYKTGTHALNGVSLDIGTGEFVYIVGHTGSGKSTLIKLLDAEELPTSGEIYVDNVNVTKLRKSKIPYYRRKIGVVFQELYLLESLTVFENIAYAMEVVDAPKEVIRSRVREVLKLVDLADKASSRINELSGGQKQRVAIARAIANNPKVLIADEPTGDLDPEISDELTKLFERINEEEGTTVLIVTHDSEIVRNHPKRIIQLSQGMVELDCPKEEAKERLSNSLVKHFAPSVEVIPADEVVRKDIIDKRLTESMELKVLQEKEKDD